MGHVYGSSVRKVHHGVHVMALLAVASLTFAACGGSSDSKDSSDTTAPTTDTTGEATDTTVPASDAPTGVEMKIGLVNTEGTPGLDFPDIRRFMSATIDYLNLHGGMGNRPMKLETCVAKGSPETSQVCAQELIGKGVELVLLGLDLFPDYKTYGAANVPVIGVLPILTPDYTADALFLTGGNATTMGAFAALAKDHFKAKTIGIVQSDNAGSNSTAASLMAALDVAGIKYKAVKGGDNETDAGYQGLMREAAKDNPDLLVSLYADAGCIGTMRGRASLGIKIPVITTSICADKDVLDAVGEDAMGWVFAGASEDKDTPERAIMREILQPIMNVPAEEITGASLGLGGLGYLQIMSLVDYANQMQAAGTEVTGASLYSYLKTTKGLFLFGGIQPIDCGAAPKYPAVCSFSFPMLEYKGAGKLGKLEGVDLVDSTPYLP